MAIEKMRLDESFSGKIFTKALTGETGDHIDWSKLSVDATSGCVNINVPIQPNQSEQQTPSPSTPSE